MCSTSALQLSYVDCPVLNRSGTLIANAATIRSITPASWTMSLGWPVQGIWDMQPAAEERPTWAREGGEDTEQSKAKGKKRTKENDRGYDLPKETVDVTSSQLEVNRLKPLAVVKAPLE